MADDPELIEQCEAELQAIIAKMLSSGIRVKVVRFILQDILNGLEVQEYCEAWLGQYVR